jgi:hypothetical protein
VWYYNIYFFHSTYGLFPLNKNCPYCGLYLTVTLICCQNKGGTTGISGRSNQACSKEFWPGFQHVSTIPPSPMHPPNPVNLGAIGFSLGLLRKTSYQKNATDRIPAFSKRETQIDAITALLYLLFCCFLI